LTLSGIDVRQPIVEALAGKQITALVDAQGEAFELTTEPGKVFDYDGSLARRVREKENGARAAVEAQRVSTAIGAGGSLMILGPLLWWRRSLRNNEIHSKATR
jgi:hypothetical protein